MPEVQRKGDSNSVGGKISTGDNSVLVNGIPIAVEGAPVTPHTNYYPPHTSAQTVAQKAKSVLVNGKPIIVKGDTDTCGDSRIGGSSDVFAGK